MSGIRRANWQLPPGVTRGLWEYTQAEHIAGDYDEFFAHNSLFQFDQAVLARHITDAGLVVDLGCGTGRALLPLVRRGMRGLAVDLSTHMLRQVGQKAAIEGLHVDRLLANMTELDCLSDGCADYCLLMFSTLGMIRGRENRQQVLAHTRRILKPEGLLVVHVHNVWYNLFDPVGRWWLLGRLLRRLALRGDETGDKFFDYRGIPNMFLHVFTRRELTRALRRAGFTVRELIPLSVTRQRPLPHPWWLGRIRANGWIAVCGRER